MKFSSSFLIGTFEKENEEKENEGSDSVVIVLNTALIHKYSQK